MDSRLKKILLLSLSLLSLALIFLFISYTHHEKIIQPVQLAPPHWLEINDQRIHYIQAGKGADLVLVHGMSSSVFIWRHIFPLLAQKYRVTAFDWPGHGQSSKNEHTECSLDSSTRVLTELFEKLNIENPILIGHSMGGALVSWWSHLDPFKAQSLVLVVPALQPQSVFVSPKQWATWIEPTAKQLMSLLLVKFIYKNFILHKQIPDLELASEQYYRPYQESDITLNVFGKCLGLVSDKRLDTIQWQRKSIPTLLLLARHDRLLSIKDFQIQSHWSVIIDENSGHQPMEENPDAFFQSINSFLK